MADVLAPSHAHRRRVPSRVRHHGTYRVGLLVASVPLLLFLVAPLVSLFMRVAPTTFLTSLTTPAVLRAMTLSTITSCITVCLTLAAGTPVAYLLARRHFRGRALLDTLIDLPMVLPPAVAGIALLLAFGPRGLLGSFTAAWGLDLAFTSLAVVLAQTFVAAPFYIKTATSAFVNIDRALEQAAQVNGATSTQVFRLITLPLAGPLRAAGTIMTWARAVGEFGATLFFAGNYPGRTQTMPLAIFVGFESNFDVALTLAVVLVIGAFGALCGVKLILRWRRAGV